MRGTTSGTVIIAVIGEARKEFGDPRTWNRQAVTAWVRRRVMEVSGGSAAQLRPFEPRGFDHKQAQSGDRDG